MRTTLEIEDDVLEAARSVASAEGLSLGAALSRLARKGLQPQLSDRERNGFPVFDVPENATPITLEMVQRALED